MIWSERQSVCLSVNDFLWFSSRTLIPTRIEFTKVSNSSKPSDTAHKARHSIVCSSQWSYIELALEQILSPTIQWTIFLPRETVRWWWKIYVKNWKEKKIECVNISRRHRHCYSDRDGKLGACDFTNIKPVHRMSVVHTTVSVKASIQRVRCACSCVCVCVSTRRMCRCMYATLYRLNLDTYIRKY